MTQPQPSTTTGGMFSRVVQDRASQLIVDQLKGLMRDGRLTAGDRLPSERALCEEFGVSRVTVREALRVLEASGLVAIKVGANGGAFVTTPSRERLSAGLADLVVASDLSASSVTEAREVFEVGILPLVVERATEEDVTALLELVDVAEAALADGSYTIELSAQFHQRLAECTHNPAIEMLVHSFYGPMVMSLQEAREAAPAMGQRGTEEHREIALAIRARDVAKATAVMSAHLSRTAERLAHG